MKNVKVLSLGKEEGASRLTYLLRFYKYIFTERKNYDSVFVHMNQEYVILGAIFWKIWRKKILLWYNHKVGTLATRIAIMFSHNVFHTSKFAFTATSKKAKIMPVGIDTESFRIRDSVERKKGYILSLGRIDPVKNIHILIEGLKLINKGLTVNIYGSGSGKYYDETKKESENVNNNGNNTIVFKGNVPNKEAPEIYNQHEFFVNLTDSGSLDKTILEAMACGTLPIVSNKSFIGILPEWLMFKENDSQDLAKKIEHVVNLNEQEKKDTAIKLRDIVVKKHDLQMLIKNVLEYA